MRATTLSLLLLSACSSSTPGPIRPDPDSAAEESPDGRLAADAARVMASDAPNVAPDAAADVEAPPGQCHGRDRPVHARPARLGNIGGHGAGLAGRSGEQERAGGRCESPSPGHAEAASHGPNLIARAPQTQLRSPDGA